MRELKKKTVLLVSPDRRVVGKLNSAADAAEFKSLRPHWTEVAEHCARWGAVLTDEHRC